MCLLCVRDIIYLNLDSVDAIAPSTQYFKENAATMANLVVVCSCWWQCSGRLVGNHRVFQYHRKVWSWKILNLNPEHRALAYAKINVMVKRKSFLGSFGLFG